MEAFLVSTGVVALGEMGDKTQLLAIVLAAAFRKPMVIIAGIFVATIVNHAAAGALGGWVAAQLGPDILRWVIGVSFIAMAGWMLVPDKIDEDAAKDKHRFGVFWTTVVAFWRNSRDQTERPCATIDASTSSFASSNELNSLGKRWP